ncbi:MAG TPA: hypothetical protein VEB21_00325 [Terriglobales bacterium]|nr:hypothetical protein [Terriglobales bacterium]
MKYSRLFQKFLLTGCLTVSLGLASASPASAYELLRCTLENPATWGLRYRLTGAAVTPAGCRAKCVAGGGNGYFAINAPLGWCVCGTPRQPESIQATVEGCNSVCPNTESECGGTTGQFSNYADPVATATPTEVPAATETPTPPATATATATPTESVGSLAIDKVVLSRGRDTTPRDNGAIRLQFSVDDAASLSEEDLLSRLLAGGYFIAVSDADGSFAIALDLEGCQTGRVARCRSYRDGIRNRISLLQDSDTPERWEIRVFAYGFADPLTGPIGRSVEAPVRVTLTGPTESYQGSTSACRAPGKQALRCRN